MEQDVKRDMDVAKVEVDQLFAQVYFWQQLRLVGQSMQSPWNDGLVALLLEVGIAADDALQISPGAEITRCSLAGSGTLPATLPIKKVNGRYMRRISQLVTNLQTTQADFGLIAVDSWQLAAC